MQLQVQGSVLGEHMKPYFSTAQGHSSFRLQDIQGHDRSEIQVAMSSHHTTGKGSDTCDATGNLVSIQGEWSKVFSNYTSNDAHMQGQAWSITGSTQGANTCVQAQIQLVQV